MGKHKHDFERRHITNPLDIFTFAFAGKAFFTLVGKTTRYTYKVEKSEDGKVFFVAVFVGSDNTDYRAYQYAGVVRTYEQADPQKWEFTWTQKSLFKEDDKAVAGFAWFFREVRKAQILQPHSLGQVEFWHEGRCGRCGARLTVPESIARGLGPECAKVRA